MIHSKDMNQKIFFDLESEGVEFGQGSFKVYKGDIPL
jgi:hypothetical protein